MSADVQPAGFVPVQGGRERCAVRPSPPNSTFRGPPVVQGLVQGRGLRLAAGGVGEVLTVRQVAAMLGVHPSTIYGMVEGGGLEHFRVSNAIRITRAAVERLKGA